jgi:hypothetical protein
LYGAVVEPTIHRQFIILGIGFTIIVMGAWRLFHGLLPNERRFFKLRAEVDTFVKLVRHLNTASYQLKENTSPDHSQTIRDLQDEMHAAVDRMVAVAAVHDDSEPSVALDSQQGHDKAGVL